MGPLSAVRAWSRKRHCCHTAPSLMQPSLTTQAALAGKLTFANLPNKASQNPAGAVVRE